MRDGALKTYRVQIEQRCDLLETQELVANVSKCGLRRQVCRDRTHVAVEADCAELLVFPDIKKDECKDSHAPLCILTP